MLSINRRQFIGISIHFYSLVPRVLLHKLQQYSVPKDSRKAFAQTHTISSFPSHVHKKFMRNNIKNIFLFHFSPYPSYCFSHILLMSLLEAEIRQHRMKIMKTGSFQVSHEKKPFFFFSKNKQEMCLSF
jgi:hypothetical protein